MTSRFLRWLPGLLLAACFGYWLHVNGVADTAVLLFLAVQAVAYALPGMLGWRVLRQGRDPGIVDLVLGTIAMHAAMVPWYIAVRWLGAPRLAWLLPVLVVLAALLVARRRGQRLTGAERLPLGVAWHGALAVAVGLSLIANRLPATSGPGRRWPNTDNPFLMSLAADLKHHMPGTMPFVTGQRMDYHWFTFTDIAATSWMSGQELDVLTFVLVPVGLLVLGLAGFGVLGWKVTGSATGGVLALWIAVGVGSINLVGGVGGEVLDGTLLRVNWIGSITQAFATVIAMALLLVAVDLLRARRTHAADWALFVLLGFVIAGAKASFVPVLGAGALVAFLVAIRTPERRARVFALGALLGVDLVFAQVVLFHGASQGIVFGPDASLEHVGQYLGLGEVPAEVSTAGVVAVLFFLLLGWLLPLLAVLGLVLPGVGGAGGTRRWDLVGWWLLGMLGVGVVATLALDHPGLSQYFFLRSALPFAALGIAAGLLVLWRHSPPPIRHAAVLAAGAGLLIALAVRSDAAALAPRPLRDVVLAVLAPLLVVAVAAVVGAALAGDGGRRTAAVLLAAAVALGMGGARTAGLAASVEAPRANVPGVGPAVIPLGGITAARYVRSHSDPDEMFATNAHCRQPGQAVCRTLAHWMSAWTERRAVVEGWGYAPRANAQKGSIVEVTSSPFWDPDLLALNDRVFTDPSPEAARALADRFDVRWLIVDRRFPADVAGMRAVFGVHVRFGQVTLFDLTSAR